MKKSEMKALAGVIAADAKSIKSINNEYAAVKLQHGTEVAKEVIDLAKEMYRKAMESINGQRDEVVASINGERVLRAVFADLCKDKEYKKLCWEATCRCANVSELVANWYPHTINGVPARKVATEDGGKVWMVKEITRSNAASVLVACIKNVAKARKHQKSGTEVHEEGEQA